MLVLTRKIGEQVVIGDNIRVTVVSVGPGRVKIGIEAPSNVSVDRAEIHEKKLIERAPAQIGPPAPVGEEVAVLHNRIAGITETVPVAMSTAVEQTPAPRLTTVGNPTPASIRARINRKPR
jgi:carbon storage regulator